MEAELSGMVQTDLIQIGGAGPAGLAAATTLARAGRRVLLHEAQSEVGHRFDGDFQGLENWSTQQDALDLLREIRITTEFAMLPWSIGRFSPCWATAVTAGFFRKIGRGYGMCIASSALSTSRGRSSDCSCPGHVCVTTSSAWMRAATTSIAPACGVVMMIIALSGQRKPAVADPREAEMAKKMSKFLVGTMVD